ncbi:hypothetical protein [Spirochaeta africana]|uniref:Uncharacterized protein n=1 Tax=Spirochaeta africana (strain ATCC 700263 / DSM 8902 / Z-7692) TaxID=889378 RepID=H9UK24_SPIAZ|nr:hypothetical protein [Spirochaeta africana]AFG37867.1 hypothetical protein Spiaf_1810 [Spirochaeta africana DSM 8902]
MKMTPEFTKAQANMQPGVITSTGFLGDDRRNLADIIEADRETMTKLGIEFEIAAARMRHLMEEGRKGLGEPVTVDGTWLVRTDEARGFLASPFEDGIFRKVNVEVWAPGETEDSGNKIIYTELSLHLFERYHFMQGKGSPFRLEPDDLRDVLRL